MHYIARAHLYACVEIRMWQFPCAGKGSDYARELTLGFRSLQVFIKYHCDGSQQKFALRCYPELIIAHNDQAICFQLLQISKFKGEMIVEIKGKVRFEFMEANFAMTHDGFNDTAPQAVFG